MNLILHQIKSAARDRLERGLQNASALDGEESAEFSNALQFLSLKRAEARAPLQ